MESEKENQKQISPNEARRIDIANTLFDSPKYTDTIKFDLISFLVRLIPLFSVLSPILLAPIQQMPYSVLLLRKFKKRKGSIWSLGQLLGDVCDGIAVPITIQDQSFHGTSSPKIELAKKLIFFAIFLICIITCIFLSGISQKANAGLIISIFLFTIFKITADKLLDRLDLGEQSTYNFRIFSIIDAIRSKQYRFFGTQVIRLHNDTWRSGVSTILKEVNAAVIDVTEHSNNIEWEIKETYIHLPARAVILTFDCLKYPYKGGDIELPIIIKSWLGSIIEPNDLSQSRIIPYMSSGLVTYLHKHWRAMVSIAITASIEQKEEVCIEVSIP